MSLARRSITSITWNFAANGATVVVLAARMILLTRWLTPEIFGAYAFAMAIIMITSILPNFGMGQAFIHRAPQTENEQEAAAVHFTLRLLFTLLWAALLLVGALILADGSVQLALLVGVPVYLGIQLTQTPRLILQRRVAHQRLAAVSFTEVILTTILALTLAWNGAGIWALLVTDIVVLIVKVVFLYLWRPVWRPRLRWDEGLVRYYLRFGSRAFTAEAFLTTTDNIDDLWTGYFLGQAALGIYSRAYAFATYPRKLLAAPINAVAAGTYAELKGDRHRLSQSFFRVNALLIRAGFLFAGALALVAPELVLILGEQWQEMLTPFRLMLIFVLLDPIRMTIGLLFVAVGEPQKLAGARGVQLAVLLGGLFILGFAWGINGVALAVDLMLVVGIVVMLRHVRAHVDFSTWRLFAVPLLAVSLALGAALLLSWRLPALNVWLLAFLKLLLYTVVYLLIWLAAERQEALRMVEQLRRSLARQAAL